MSRRKLLLALIDSALFFAVQVFVYLLFFLKGGERTPLQWFLNFLVLFSITMISRLSFRVYRIIWRHSGAESYIVMVVADAVAGLVGYGVTRLIPGINIGFWETVCVFSCFCLVTLSARFCYQLVVSMDKKKSGDHKINVAIVGAGAVGTLLAQELTANQRSHYKPHCFFDNDPEKIGGTVLGLHVYPDDETALERLAAMPIQEVFIAIPSLSAAKLEEIYERFAKSGLKVKLYDLPVSADNQSENGKRHLREVHVEDLLFRDSLVLTDMQDTMRAYYRDKVVLVTGGGGSIGRELCRQIARLSPKKLIILDIYENNAYEIQQELIARYGAHLDLAVEIASVRDRTRLETVFAAYRPEVVFHAAAHKHVPLMEHSSSEAIKNNVFGTANTADMAEKYGTEKFILISTDKAVNPTNIMGASKRMCEMVVQCRRDSATQFVAVRFGNVLGSGGSVIPLFRRQIEEGGPVTITDKRIIRYFMTIPEASSLVMCAGAGAKGGEIFVLDMGRPVKILDLAEKMISLSGLVPYKDIDIVEVGLRPGEKLYEELLMRTEELDATENKMIFIERDTPLTRDEVAAKLNLLADALEEGKNELCSAAVKRAFKITVPTYHDPEEVNRTAETSEEMKNVRA